MAIDLSALNRGIGRAKTDVNGAVRMAVIEAVKAKTAEVVQAQSARAGVAPATRTFVDGALGAPLEIAKSTIRVEFSYLRETVVVAMRTLFKISPVGEGRNGHYRDKFIALVNGVQVSQIPLLGFNDEVTITNLAPYARKIEQDYKKAYGGGSHVFERAQRGMHQMYGKALDVRFSYVNVEGAPSPKRPSRKSRRKQLGAADERLPALILKTGK